METNATRVHEATRSGIRGLFRPSALSIRLRLIACFILIVLLMIAADAVTAWQYWQIEASAQRVSKTHQISDAVVRVHLDVYSVRDKMAALASSHDRRQFSSEAASIRQTFLQHVDRAEQMLRATPDIEQDARISGTLESLRGALPSQLDTAVQLAIAGEWDAVQLRLAIQIPALIELSSSLVERVDEEARQQRTRAIEGAQKARQRLFIIVPIAALLTLLAAAALGWYVTRTVTGPLSVLTACAEALARGDFQHRVHLRGNNELAVLGNAFNYAAQQLRKLYEDLRQSENYLAEAQGLSHTGSFGWSVSSGEIYWSEETYTIFEYDRTVKPTLELVFQRIHPDDRDLTRQTIDHACNQRKDFDHEHRLLMPDGSVKHLHVLARALETSSGGLEFVGAVTDVTERERAEEALRRSKLYLTEAQRLSHTGSWAWDVATRRSVHWSPEHYRIFGFAPDEVIPSDEEFFERIHPEDRRRVIENFERAIFREKSDFDVDYRIVLPGGSIKHVRSIGHPVFKASGDLVEFVGTVMDVTEHKHAEAARDKVRQLGAELAHISRVSTMGELAASIAHEVNQPLSGVVVNATACLNWLAANPPNLVEVRETVQRIVRDGQRAGDVIARIRAMATKRTTEKERVDLNETIQETLVLVQGLVRRNKVALHMDLSDNLPLVLGDRIQLQQVVLNLVVNGIEAMAKVASEQRELVIGTQTSPDGTVEVVVRDSGAGLDTESMQKIFEAFYTTKPGGMGMGLSISRTIIRNHGGRLWATRNDGPGVTLHFTVQKDQ